MPPGLEERPHGFGSDGAYFAERVPRRVGLIVTGGIGPERRGQRSPLAPRKIPQPKEAEQPQGRDSGGCMKAGGKICCRILHAVVTPYSPKTRVSASCGKKAPIHPFTPRRAGRGKVIEKPDSRFVHLFSNLPRVPAMTGVEIMGSEGYLSTVFLVSTSTSVLTAGAGSYENRRLRLAGRRSCAGWREGVGATSSITTAVDCWISDRRRATWDEVVNAGQGQSSMAG